MHSSCLHTCIYIKYFDLSLDRNGLHNTSHPTIIMVVMTHEIC